MRPGKDVLGSALVGGGANSIGAVFFSRVLDLERRSLAGRGAILGAVMAHEIGHLLLERTDHSPFGILRASWNDADLKAIAQRRMDFTPQQGSMISRRR